MKTKLFFCIIIIAISVFIGSCSNKKSHSEDAAGQSSLIISGFDISKLKNASELNENLTPSQFTNFKIVYFDNLNKKLFISLDSQPNKYYFTYCVIDSVFEYKLLGTDMPERFYLGKFKFISDIYGDFTFLAIDGYNSKTGKYTNLFNDYYILDDASLDITFCDNFIGKDLSSLIVSYNEGTGNYLDFRIYGLQGKAIKEIFEPRTPLENGTFAIDSNTIYLLEGIITSRLKFSAGKVQQEFLEESPAISFRKGDLVLNLLPDNEGFFTFPKLIFLNSQSSLYVIAKGKIAPEKNLLINYDKEYFDRNFNAFVPKQDGMTTIEFINYDKVVAGKVR